MPADFHPPFVGPHQWMSRYTCILDSEALELNIDSTMPPFDADLKCYPDDAEKYADDPTHFAQYISKAEDGETDSAPFYHMPDNSDVGGTNTQYADGPSTPQDYLDYRPALYPCPSVSSTFTTPTTSSTSTPTRPSVTPTDISTDLALWACRTPACLLSVCELPEREEDDAADGDLALFPAPPTFSSFAPMLFLPRTYTKRQTYGRDLDPLNYDHAVRISVDQWLTICVDSVDGSVALTTENRRKEFFVDKFDAVHSAEEWILDSDDVPAGVKWFHGHERWLIMREVAGYVRAKVTHAPS
ncbi:hypothetical protein CYLTODRAFT_494770 [Cylindrobasidium torrendii FP15055 ss-10]|uniref:Uncharacterized protein n=1 Tax=Cylindrobasidium torrendii FP15055 ss-10 TaxID=1314674 RepID=A0A0D7AYB0_9AGAR|nr:hypothetical protein CYLTODRAFT_494770 [Cylindrobasidium torrendii FP15055 ss-10]